MNQFGWIREMLWRLGLSRVRRIDPDFGAIHDHGTFASSSVYFAPVGRQIEIIVPGRGGIIQPWQKSAFAEIERKYSHVEREVTGAAANYVSAEAAKAGSASTGDAAPGGGRGEFTLECLTLPETAEDSTRWEATLHSTTTRNDYAVRVRRWAVYEVENLDR